jgi:gingipain R
MPIAPSKGSLTRNIDPSEVPYTFGSIYQTNGFYPSQFAEVNSTYLLRQQKGVSLSVLPVQVNPVTNTIRIASKIIFKVSYISEKGKKVNFNLPNYIPSLNPYSSNRILKKSL